PRHYASPYPLQPPPPTPLPTLSLHDALPIFVGPHQRARGAGDRLGKQPRRGLVVGPAHRRRGGAQPVGRVVPGHPPEERVHPALDRKSTRLNSSHVAISYAVFCLKKKK